MFKQIAGLMRKLMSKLRNPIFLCVLELMKVFKVI